MPVFKSSTMSTSRHEPISNERSTAVRPSQNAAGMSTTHSSTSCRNAASSRHAARKPAMEKNAALMMRLRPVLPGLPMRSRSLPEVPRMVAGLTRRGQGAAVARLVPRAERSTCLPVTVRLPYARDDIGCVRMALTVSTRFGNFEVIALIGAGGMGEVFRARDTNLKRDVALKVLPPAFMADRDRVARFQREAELLAALNHPNIAHVYGLEKSGEQTAIVMELVEGPTLAERIARAPIPPDEAMRIALQVVAALEAAHEKQIVHRDLKPANVKVRVDGMVKVLDFGISKPIDPRAISGGSAPLTTPAMTETGVILGTAAYMSPEQARGKLVDERTDIWAFGCLLYEMLTGKPPFGDEDVMLTLARVLDRDADFASIPQTIAPAVRHTIKLCLQKDPRKRIADIRDVRLALEGRLESERGGVTAATAIARPLWHRSLLPVGAFAAGVGLALLAALTHWAEPPAPRVSRQIYRPPMELAPAFLSNPPMLAVAPDGSEFAYVSRAGLVRRVLSELDGRV